LKDEDRANKFDCADTWNEVRAKGNKVEWWNLVWFSLAIPRYSFVGWMAILNKFQGRNDTMGS